MRAPELAAEMARRGHIEAGAEPLPFGTGGRPWYVSAVLGAAGWLASLFGFLFIAISLSPDTPSEFAVSGTLLLAAGFGLYRAAQESAFFEQLALALSLAGQLCLLWAVGETTESATAVAAFAVLLSAGVVSAFPDHFIKALSSFFASVAW
ncbi:MAG: DUF4401 domain-containing protein, partial [Longimicrobiales bacterium]|nr:DUF4401 domain-containing protein [Longimicrobiales bacterium]